MLRSSELSGGRVIRRLIKVHSLFRERVHFQPNEL
jgi:hypothetical protein